MRTPSCWVAMSNHLSAEIRTLFPGREFRVVLDVGANNGRFARRMADAIPEARITCFEPAPRAFALLTKAVASVADRVTAVQMALGCADGVVRFTTTLGMGNRVVGTNETVEAETVEVPMRCGDHYCDENGITEIDLLKIDTEGNDLDCLVGFARMLREKRIFLIEVEATTNLDNRFHVHVERFIHWLHPFGYRVVSIGDFARRVHATKQDLNGSWFCNALFVCEREGARLRRDGRN